MNIQIQKAKDKPYETIPYVSWLKSYVKNGKAHLYDKINYPDLAKLKQRDSYGFIIKKSIVDLRIAKNIEKNEPEKNAFTLIDKEKLKRHQLKYSVKIEWFNQRIHSCSKKRFFKRFKWIYLLRLYFYRTFILYRNFQIVETENRLTRKINKTIIYSLLVLVIMLLTLSC